MLFIKNFDTTILEKNWSSKDRGGLDMKVRFFFRRRGIQRNEKETIIGNPLFNRCFLFPRVTEFSLGGVLTNILTNFAKFTGKYQCQSLLFY